MLPATPRHALGLLALLLGLTACSGDPEPIYANPTPEATGSSSTAPTPAPTPSPSGSGGTPSTGSPSSPPTTPVPADESAREFLIRFQAEAFAMQNSGNTSRYRSMSVSGCVGCQQFADYVDRVYRAGGEIAVRPGTVRGLERVGQIGNQQIFEYDLIQYPTRYRESADARAMRLPGGTERYQVTVIRGPSRWMTVRSELQ